MPGDRTRISVRGVEVLIREPRTKNPIEIFIVGKIHHHATTEEIRRVSVPIPDDPFGAVSNDVVKIRIFARRSGFDRRHVEMLEIVPVGIQASNICARLDPHPVGVRMVHRRLKRLDELLRCHCSRPAREIGPGKAESTTRLEM